MRAEKLCQELALKQIQQLRMQGSRKKDSGTEKGNGKEREKPSIHERLEINKRIIQEKQGKDKPARGADLSVRTV